MNSIDVANEQQNSELENTSFSDASRLAVEVVQNTILPSIHEDPYDMVSLKQFLQRPFNVIEKDWASSNVVSDLLIDLALPDVVFKLKPISYKLNNFRYFRAGLRIGIRVNGTKFHYGKILAAWKPSYQEVGMDPYNNNVYNASCYPHVVISATENEVTEMIVPFCLPYKYIDLDSSDKKDMGQLQVFVLNPLKIANEVPPTVSISVFLSFENVEIAGLTSFDRIAAQGAIGEARAKASKGIISGVFEGITTIAGSIKSIPIVSGYAGMVERLAGTIGNVAKSFGFCKPNDISNWAPRILRNWNLAYSHGLENAPTMALDPENMIVPSYDIVGSHQDEMSISHLVSTPSLVAIYDWTDSSGEIAHIGVDPTLCYSKDGADLDGNLGTIYTPTVLSWTCMPFRYWRGSLKFCIQVTCSAFHSGRLRISWEPSIPLPVDVADVYRNAGANRVNHVMDIQSETEYYCTIPYLRPFAWTDMENAMRINGNLVIEAINHLTHPEKPIPPVYINVWLAGGPDFQLAYLNQDSLSVPVHLTVKAQGMTRDQMRSQVFPPMLKSTDLSIDDHVTMGEVVTHIKDIINRPSSVATFPLVRKIGNNTRVTEYSTNIPTNLSLDYRFLNLEASPNTYLQHFRALFRYMRGSVTFKVMCIDGCRTIVNGTNVSNGGPLKINSGFIKPNLTDSKSIGDASLARGLYNNTGMIAINTLQTSNLEGTVPFYSPVYSIISSYSKIMKSPEVYPSIDITMIPEQFQAGPEDTFFPPIINILHSAGDDLILGFQVAPPAFFVKKASTNNLCGSRINIGSNDNFRWVT